MEKINCAQARQIDLVHYLALLGHRPVKIIRSDYWYLSPLREEKTPSFKVSRKLNMWYDHGIGKGGDLIDFGVLYFRCGISDLLQILTQQMALNLSFQPPIISPRPSPSAGEKKETEGGRITIVAARPLANESLLHYLQERKISYTVADRFCREVDFLLYGRKHTVIGFENNSGGYELRSASFKGSAAPKDFTFIAGTGDNQAVSVLEGFTDFLSLVTLKGQAAETSFLVLNSLSFVVKSIPILSRFVEINLYLDHDPAGRVATLQLQQSLPQAKDASLDYSQHKDLNEYLVQLRSNNRKPSLPKQEDVTQKPKRTKRLGRSL